MAVEGPCNDRCVVCPVPEPRRVAPAQPAAVAASLARAVAQGADSVVFAGGEPTLLPRFVEHVRAARQAGLAVGVVTNGRMFAYARLARAAARAGLGSATVAVHGPDAATHQAVSRSEGFDQALEGARHLAACGVEVTLRLTLLAASLDRLADLPALLDRTGAARLALELPDAVEEGVEVARRDAAEVAVAALVDRFARSRLSGRLDVAALPPCWTGGASGGVALRPGAVFAAPCADCSLRSRCPGLPAAMVDALGDAAVAPFRVVRSNSFNLVPRQRLDWPAGTPCPLLVGAPAPRSSADRAIHLRSDGALVRHETTTGDFVDAELRRVLRDSGQLYVDVSDKDAPDDFAADLRKLVVATECDECPRQRRCGRAWQVDQRDVFGADDALVAQRIATLSGDVLDVGCGHGPYGELLAPLASGGALRYVGLEPDEARVRELRARWPWATLIAATAEEARFAEASFDHVLILRSYNHLAAPRAVLAAVTRALRPGGTLLVVDNEAFGLVRTREAAARAEAGSAEHEHYRNDGAAEALEAMRGLPLTLLARADVGPATSNQWLLHLRKHDGDAAAPSLLRGESVV